MATQPQDVELYDELAGTPQRPQTDYTYDDLLAFPEDNVRREVIGGELIVSPSPAVRHQQVVLALGALLLSYEKEAGGLALASPMDTMLTPVDVVQPDVLFVRADHLDRARNRPIQGPPDLVVEVSSPSSRRLELRRKRDLYEAHRVPEYWYVDLDAESIHVYRLEAERFVGSIAGRGDVIAPPHLPGLMVAVDDVLGL